LTAVLSDGRVIQTADCTDEMFEKVKEFQKEDNEFELINLLIPEEPDKEDAYRTYFVEVTEKAQSSEILEIVKRGDEVSMYWKNVSPLSLPPELAERILEAEKNGDDELIKTYANFWTLLSLNPDEVVRRNLFKFLNKWGMVISKSGLFVGYRNVDVKYLGETPEDTIYTDHHSHSTTIKIGCVTSIPRSSCNNDSGVECSSGLHIGGTSWLQQHYFGDTGLVCLVNPVDVVAVPWASAEYGKIRTCAYLPIGVAQYDYAGCIIPYTDKDGFDSKYVKTILYDGIMSPEKNPEYSVVIRDRESYSDYKTVSDKLLEVARKFIKDI